MNVRGMYILGYRCLMTMNMTMNTSPTAYHYIRRAEEAGTFLNCRTYPCWYKSRHDGGE